MGPFKHTVDDGLDVRKAAFECMYTLLESCLDRLDIYEYLNHVEDGLKDHYDVRVGAVPELWEGRHVPRVIPSLGSGLELSWCVTTAWSAPAMPVPVLCNCHSLHLGLFSSSLTLVALKTQPRCSWVYRRLNEV